MVYFQLLSTVQGWVVRKLVNANPWLKVNWCIDFLCVKNVFSYLCFVYMYFWDYPNSKLKDKQYKQKTSPQSYKIEIKILVNPGLASSGFEQRGPVLTVFIGTEHAWFTFNILK